MQFNSQRQIRKRSICGLAINSPWKSKSYINYKIRILSEIGICNKAKLKSYLESETANIRNEVRLERRVDELCRKLIINYFEGDETFI